ncbi:colicin-like pore-forming protein [Pseudomonas koreensis]
MRQLDLPATIFYGDGSWEIINLNSGNIRGDILKNYPLGNPMHGLTLAIESDYLEIGFQEGNWKPLMLELESIAAGMGAGALLAVTAAYFFPALVNTVPGIVVVGLLIALAAAFLSADNVEKINTLILDQFNGASSKG